MERERIYLSAPDVGEAEKEAVLRALDSGWVAPLGPEVDGFEDDICRFTGARHAVALSSGTAALHLALLELGVGSGDQVLVPTLTFGATAFAVTYTGAEPVFVDSEMVSWNIDPDLVAEHLERTARSGRLPKAVIPVDLFGRTADYDRLLPICAQYDVPVMVDAAESLGSLHGSQMAGTMGVAGIYSFNGNKIMTTSGGGMLVTDDAGLAARVRHLSTQARERADWYEHSEVGFNYRMSNVLAALGRAQLARLPEMIERRRDVQARYRHALSDLALSVTDDPQWCSSNSWLTTALLEGESTPGRVIASCDAAGIEARHVWKPMHSQPVFASCEFLTHSDRSTDIFSRGVCLPSGSGMNEGDLERVIAAVTAGCQAEILSIAEDHAGAGPSVSGNEAITQL